MARGGGHRFELRVGVEARAHDFTLLSVADPAWHQITIAECQLLAAPGQVMGELASLGTGPSWEGLERA